MDEIIYVNRKGGTVLLYNGRQFYKQRSYKNNDIIWNCSKLKKDKCRGSLTMRGNHVIKEKPHSCQQDFERNDVDDEINKLKEKIRTSDTPVPQLFKQTKNVLLDKGLGLCSSIPTLDNIKTACYACRGKSNFKNGSDVIIPQQFEDILLCDYVQGDCRIIVFCSLNNRKEMEKLTEYFGDGTFMSCPGPFQQLYTIHGDAGSTYTTTNVIPLVYALMTDRTEESYIILFEMIKSAIPGWSPQKNHIDVEIAVSNTLFKVFPNIIIKYCYYHFTKNLWKKARDLKMNRKRERRLVGLCSALPLLPLTYIEEGWTYIRTTCAEKTKMKKFIKYMSTFWLKNSQFRSQWCVNSERHRTNNTVESWNSRLNKAMKKKGPNSVQRLLNALILLEKDNEQEESKQRRQEYMDDDDFIMETQLKLLNQEICVGLFLETLR